MFLNSKQRQLVYDQEEYTSIKNASYVSNFINVYHIFRLYYDRIGARQHRKTKKGNRVKKH